MISRQEIKQSNEVIFSSRKTVNHIAIFENLQITSFFNL